MKRFGDNIANLLERPGRVLGICFCLVLGGVVFDGSLWRLYHIEQNQENLTMKIREENAKISKIKQQLGQLKNPAYIEKQARERLEFLEKEDLLFVFSED